ncbi:MAG: DUF3298 domain-containing protein [Lachnotalea sp.]
MKKIIILMVICIMLPGCSTLESQNAVEDVAQIPIQEENDIDALVEDNGIEAVEEMPSLDNIDISINDEEKSIEPLVIEVHTLENEYKEDDVLLARVKIDYPIIISTTGEEGLTKINEFFEESAQALYEENNTYASDNMQAIKEETFSDSNPSKYSSEYLVTYEMKYNANGYLSILEKFSENNYGVTNSNCYDTGYVFNIMTGDRLAINDILLGTEEEIAQTIGTIFIDSNKITDIIKTKYKEEILANTQYVGFYIDDKNLNFFYDPNMVAPYSEGSLEASIPLNTENIFELNIPQIY